MHIHYLQHVHFEGPAAVEDWARQAGHSIAGSHLYRGEPLPEPDTFDLQGNSRMNPVNFAPDEFHKRSCRSVSHGNTAKRSPS